MGDGGRKVFAFVRRFGNNQDSMPGAGRRIGFDI